MISKSDIFSFSKDGLRLVNPIKEIGLVFTDVLWDADADKLFLVASTGDKVEILISATPIIPLHISMGFMVKKMDVPGTVALPGSSTSFVSAYNTMRTTILTRFTTLTTPRDFGISFNAVNKTCVVYMVIVQGTNGFPANYTFNYTKTDNGEYKFIGPPVVSGGGGAAIAAEMNTFLLNRMAAQTFTLDYYVDSANNRVLGKMTSKETPTFFFTGVIN